MPKNGGPGKIRQVSLSNSASGLPRPVGWRMDVHGSRMEIHDVRTASLCIDSFVCFAFFAMESADLNFGRENP